MGMAERSQKERVLRVGTVDFDTVRKAAGFRPFGRL